MLNIFPNDKNENKSIAIHEEKYRGSCSGKMKEVLFSISILGQNQSISVILQKEQLSDSLHFVQN